MTLQELVAQQPTAGEIVRGRWCGRQVWQPDGYTVLLVRDEDVVAAGGQHDPRSEVRPPLW